MVSLVKQSSKNIVTAKAKLTSFASCNGFGIAYGEYGSIAVFTIIECILGHFYNVFPNHTQAYCYIKRVSGERV